MLPPGFAQIAVIRSQNVQFRLSGALHLVLLEFGQDNLMRQIERRRMLPVVMGDFGEPLSHMAAVSFESRFALQSLRQARPAKVVIRGGLA